MKYIIRLAAFNGKYKHGKRAKIACDKNFKSLNWRNDKTFSFSYKLRNFVAAFSYFGIVSPSMLVMVVMVVVDGGVTSLFINLRRLQICSGNCQSHTTSISHLHLRPI